MDGKQRTYRTEYAENVARRAAKLARSEQVDWKSLSQEERRQFKRRVRDEDKASGQRGQHDAE